jgi:alpha-ketoglutarate-dependent taurine dioxygenase
MSRKRGPKQIWMPVQVQVIGEGSAENAGKRQRTNSVFDRIEDPADDHEGMQRPFSVFNRLEVSVSDKAGERSDSVFNRLVNPSADPEVQGRREQ